MSLYTFDVHMHTHYSYDSLLKPKQLIKAAGKVGHSAIIVTDHNTIKGGLACERAVKDHNLDLAVYIGAEIKTELGDVIGFFLNNEIKSRQYHEVIDEIKFQNGIVYLPHPFASYTHVKDMNLNRIEALEAYNGRNNMHANRQALLLGKKLGLPLLGGSDTHIAYEMGTVCNLTSMDITQEDEFRKVILNGLSTIRVSPPSLPILPRFRMTQTMSWIRSGQSERILVRVHSFLLRQTRQLINP